MSLSVTHELKESEVLWENQAQRKPPCMRGKASERLKCYKAGGRNE